MVFSATGSWIFLRLSGAKRPLENLNAHLRLVLNAKTLLFQAKFKARAFKYTSARINIDTIVILNSFN